MGERKGQGSAINLGRGRETVDRLRHISNLLSIIRLPWFYQIATITYYHSCEHHPLTLIRPKYLIACKHAYSEGTIYC